MQGVTSGIPITLSGILGGIINIPMDQDEEGDNSTKDTQWILVKINYASVG